MAAGSVISPAITWAPAASGWPGTCNFRPSVSVGVRRLVLVVAAALCLLAGPPVAEAGRQRIAGKAVRPAPARSTGTVRVKTTGSLRPRVSAPLRAAGKKAAGTKATGTKATGTKATGTKATGTKAAGTKAAGTKATGKKATGKQATGTKAAPPREAAGAGSSRAVRGRAAVRTFARGLFIDGPRHTWQSIKRNPLAFAGGWVAIGAIGAAGRVLGFNGEIAALALSGTAVAVQVKVAWPRLKAARGLERVRLVASEVVWPAVFWTSTTLVGHSLGNHGAAAHHGAPGAGEVGTAFVSSAIVGSDAPALGVMALDSARGGAGELAAQH